jgi:hypothetical protein
MISVWQKISDAWMQTLKGHVSVDVYARDVLSNEKGNYILLEGETDIEQPIKSIGWNVVIMRAKIVTLFESLIDESVAFAIDTEIERLVRGIPGSQLVKQDDIQILEVTRQQSVLQSYMTAEKKVFEVNTRYSNMIFQRLNT